MKYSVFTVVAAFSFFCTGAQTGANPATASGSSEKRPNIVIIMADDMGFSGSRQLWQRNTNS